MNDVIGFERLRAFEQAKAEVKARYAKEWQKVSADLQAELDDLDRRYWNGEQPPEREAA